MSEHPVGGQAVIEGVMMRSPHCLAVAVRTRSGSLLVRRQPWIPLAERFRFLRWPFFRGVLALAESLHNGFSALNFSARVQEEKEDAGATAVSLWVTLAIAVVLALGLFAALPHFLTWGMGRLAGSESLSSGTSLGFQVVDGVVKLGVFLGYVLAISYIPEIRRVFQYHGAEHKAIAAFEKREALTVDNARCHTTLHPRCGTSFLLVVVLVAILVFSVVFPFVPRVSSAGAVNQAFFVLVKLVLLFPIAGVSYEVIRLAGRKPDNRWLRAFIWPGLMTQKITTRQPDSGQLEVALASLVTVLHAEEHWKAKGCTAGGGTGEEERQEEFASFEDFVKRGEQGTGNGERGTDTCTRS